MADPIPTRGALLELQEERQRLQEGYRFLDEKRLVLAATLLQELEGYTNAQAAFEPVYRDALRALREALGRHGLGGLLVYPPLVAPQARLLTQTSGVLGVPLTEARLDSGDLEAPLASLPSPEAEHCRRRFREVLERATALAAQTGNLQRLWAEYRRAARRARAIEDVLLPETERDLGLVAAGLEELEREEAIRARYFRRGEDG